MNKAIKVLLGLLCVPMLATGLLTVFSPMEMLEHYGVDPVGSHGLNTMRGALGGMQVAMVVGMVIGLWRGNTTWFLAVALTGGTVAFCRLISFGLDGVAAADLLPFTAELVLAGLLLVAHWRLSPRR
jgi:hypothetical protein